MNDARRPKASDISDAEMLDAIRAVRGRHRVAQWATRWDVEEHLSHWPSKVVQAKARSMIRRKLIDGCGCGCRGDYEILDPWDRFIVQWSEIALRMAR